MGAKKISKRKLGLRVWNPELETLVKEKKEGYFKFINNRMDQNRIDYKKRVPSSENI